MGENARVSKLEELLKRVEKNRVKLAAATSASTEPVVLPTPIEPPPSAAELELIPEPKTKTIPKPVAKPEPVVKPMPVAKPEPIVKPMPVATPAPKPIPRPAPAPAASTVSEKKTSVGQISAAGPVATVSGKISTDWTLDAVLDRAFKLGR